MLRDDHSRHSWLYFSASTDAETAANALLNCFAAFGVPTRLAYDRPTQFKNDTIRLLAKGLRTSNYFSLPYCPWSNEAVKRLEKKLLRVACSLL